MRLPVLPAVSYRRPHEQRAVPREEQAVQGAEQAVQREEQAVQGVEGVGQQVYEEIDESAGGYEHVDDGERWEKKNVFGLQQNAAYGVTKYH